MTPHVPSSVKNVVSRVKARGARALLVGGAVIDTLQGRTVKDWDLEVFGLSYEDLERLFSDMAPKTVGRAFGVLKISPEEGVEVDINVPRRDSKVGVGHKDFAITVDQTLTPKEAARRRDFTINAMGIDLDSGELIDPFGGRRDMEAGVLRVTDPETFGEDPLRALRAMQLLARKAKTVDPMTMAIIQGMVGEFPHLPKERVYEEFRKLLLKADRPSVGFEFLRQSGWLVHFPELEALIGCPQNPEWHPEGDVWTHSLLAVDAAAQIRLLVPEEQREAFMFGVFCHDLGKPEHTITQEMMDRRDPIVAEKAASAGWPVEKMLLTAHGHDIGGMDPAATFLRRMTDSVKLIELVRGIVGMHMRPWSLKAGEARVGGYARLHRQMQAAGGDLRLIGRMCQCDSCATGPDWQRRSLASGEPNWDHETSQRVFEFAEEFDRTGEAVTPKVMGRDLISAGLKPGPQFKKLLSDALDLQDSDGSLTREDILARILPKES